MRQVKPKSASVCYLEPCEQSHLGEAKTVEAPFFLSLRKSKQTFFALKNSLPGGLPKIRILKSSLPIEKTQMEESEFLQAYFISKHLQTPK